MKVIVDDNVVKAIDDFYIAAMSMHISLSEETVMAKKERLIASLESLKDYHFIYPKARWKDEWIKNDWQDFICEDFHSPHRRHPYRADGQHRAGGSDGGDV